MCFVIEGFHNVTIISNYFSGSTKISLESIILISQGLLYIYCIVLYTFFRSGHCKLILMVTFIRNISFLAAILGLPILGQSQNTLDSIDNLIHSTKDLDGKLSLIIECISNSGLSSKEEVFKYLEEGLAYSAELDQADGTRLLYTESAKTLRNLGKIDESKAMYRVLDSLHYINNDPHFKAESLLGLSYFYRLDGDTKKAKSNLREAIRYFQSANSKSGIAGCYNELGSISYTNGDIEMGRLFLDSALIVLEGQDASMQMISTYSHLGRLYRQKGDLDLAKEHYQKALDLAKEMNQLTALGITYNNIGNIEHIKGNLRKAMEYYLQSIDMKKKTNNYSGMAIGYYNIGSIEFSLEEFNDAKRYFNKSIAISEKIDHVKMVIENLIKIGGVFFNQEFLDSSDVYIDKALELSVENTYKNGELKALKAKGEIERQKENYVSSKNYFDKALDLSLKIKNKEIESGLYASFAKLFSATKKKEKSEELDLDPTHIENLLLKGLKLNESSKSADNEREILKGLSEFYLQEEDYKKGSEYQKRFITLNDSLLSDEQANATKELTIKYKTIEQENEILKLEKETIEQESKLKNYKTFLYFGLGFLIFGGLFVYRLVKDRIKINQLKQRVSFRKSLSNDLHDDVGSYLSSISLYSTVVQKKMDGDNPEIQGLLSRINDNCTRSMEAMNDIVWALDSHNDNMMKVIQRMRAFTSSLSDASGIITTYAISDNIDNINLNMLECRNVYLIFKEVINNAYKYSQAKEINVVINKDSDTCHLSITDDGVGIELNNLDPNKSLSGNGIKNIKVRAKQLNGTIKIISNLGSGTSIKLVWPLTK